MTFQGSKDVDRDGCDVKHCDSGAENAPECSNQLVRDAVREIHSCPSSPTETECSSGFSTLRRRSVTLTEKVSRKKCRVTLLERHSDGKSKSFNMRSDASEGFYVFW